MFAVCQLTTTYMMVSSSPHLGVDFTTLATAFRETVQRDTTFIQGGRNIRVYNTIGLSFCKPHSTGVHAIGAYSWLILLHHDNHFALCFVYVITFWSHHICCAVVSEPVSSYIVYSFPHTPYFTRGCRPFMALVHGPGPNW